jgi:hypothetical protein
MQDEWHMDRIYLFIYFSFDFCPHKLTMVISYVLTIHMRSKHGCLTYLLTSCSPRKKARDDAESQTHGLVALSVNCVFFQGKSRIGVHMFPKKKKKA